MSDDARIDMLCHMTEEAVSKILTAVKLGGKTVETAGEVKLPAFEDESAYLFFMDISKKIPGDPLTFREHLAVQAGVKDTLERLGFEVSYVVIEPQNFVTYLNSLEGKIKEGEAG